MSKDYVHTKDPNHERGVPFQILLKPSDVAYAKLGGTKTVAGACREGLAPYVERGKLIAAVDPTLAPLSPKALVPTQPIVRNPNKPRMEL